MAFLLTNISSLKFKWAWVSCISVMLHLLLFLCAAEDAAVSTVRHFYDKLIQLPLDEKVPALFKHYLITGNTLERVGKPCHIRAEKNGFVLQDVIETVQMKPDMLDVFCNLLQDLHVAAELAQLMKGQPFFGSKHPALSSLKVASCSQVELYISILQHALYKLR